MDIYQRNTQDRKCLFQFTDLILFGSHTEVRMFQLMLIN